MSVNVPAYSEDEVFPRESAEKLFMIWWNSQSAEPIKTLTIGYPLQLRLPNGGFVFYTGNIVSEGELYRLVVHTTLGVQTWYRVFQGGTVELATKVKV